MWSKYPIEIEALPSLWPRNLPKSDPIVKYHQQSQSLWQDCIDFNYGNKGEKLDL